MMTGRESSDAKSTPRDPGGMIMASNFLMKNGSVTGQRKFNPDFFSSKVFNDNQKTGHDNKDGGLVTPLKSVRVL